MFAHLHVHTQWSCLDGAGHVRDLVARAAEFGMNAMAVTDHGNVSAAVQFSRMAAAVGIKPIQGAEVRLSNGGHLTLLARSPKGYSNLCRVLTEAHLGTPDRAKPALAFDTLADNSDGLIVLSGCRNGEIPTLLLQGRGAAALEMARRYRDRLGDKLYIELQNDRSPSCYRLNKSLDELASHLGIPTVATGNVHYAVPDGFKAHDVLTCIRAGIRVGDVHPERRLNGERYLFDEGEARRRFAMFPSAVDEAQRIADGCEPCLILGASMAPGFAGVPAGMTADGFLRDLVYRGAAVRYPSLTDPIRQRLDHELAVIAELGLADYFLFVWDVVRYAKSQGIRCTGRGSAADSAVAYCLQLTQVDSIDRSLLFERFLSVERAGKPDIDIDFDARERDKVADYIYRTYGDDRVASVCTFSRYHARSAIRDVGKALGFPQDELDRLAKQFPHMAATGLMETASSLGIADGKLPLWRYEQLFGVCESIAGFPRHIGTHLGGVVVSRDPLTCVTPLQKAAKGVVITQFDKDFIEDLGLIKLDLLCLRTLTAVEDTSRMIGAQGGDFDYDGIPQGDGETYTRLRSGRTIGTFQLESPCQRSLQARLGADSMEDIVASVALIRPGPIAGGMVEPFVARRQRKEAITYLHPALRPILEKTFGVVLYQEQVIQIVTAIGGFSAGEADGLRRTMSHARSRDDMLEIGREFVKRAVANGVAGDVASTICDYIVAYSGYGFCEAHAAAFADTAYKTAYLVTHYPAEFYAAILNCQPMGYYPPHTVVGEAKRRGVTVLGPDINLSTDAYRARKGKIRVPLKQIHGVGEATARVVVEEREARGPFASAGDLCRRIPSLPRDVLENLALTGCFDSISPNRKQCLWEIGAAMATRQDASGPTLVLLPPEGAEGGAAAVVDDFSPWARTRYEWQLLGFGLGEHLIGHFRARLTRQGVVPSSRLSQLSPGQKVKLAGIVVRPHRPSLKSGKTLVFFCLEDEDGLTDVTVLEDGYKEYGRLIFTEQALLVEGRVERRGGGLGVVATGLREFPSA